MNIAKAAYCRVYQSAFRAALPVLPYREPEALASVLDIPKKLKQLGLRSALLVTDPSIRSLGLTKPLEDAMSEQGLGCPVYDGTAANPTVANVEAALALYKAGDCQALIGFGGGSAMDCAKAVGARLAWPGRSVRNLGGNLRIWKKGAPLFAVPTTAGTGSEATLAAFIVDEKTNFKFVMNDFSLIPDYAVLDANNTLDLPPFFTATTGMDAMTHAVEAYIGRTTTAQTRTWSVEAVQLIHRYVERAYRDGHDLEARQGMLRAAYLAGMSFTRSYVGYVHAVAHSLGGWYNTPHGLANSVLLPYVLRAYGSSAYKPLKELAVAVGVARTNTLPSVAAELFIRRIERLNRNMDIPTKLPGIRPEDIEMLAKRADREGNPLYPVPRLMDAKELQKFYVMAAEDLNGSAKEAAEHAGD
ncbi:MAG: iron-containing alcohol dehydrogenase [Oscillospiraceae bacterium]|nr:iron-containing alcohol dehydrogenase [Oscillospiraceae bacterium]